MLNVVALRKAALAGALGALAWEAVLRALALAGVPLVDLVRDLGTLAVPSAPPLLWWSIGVAAHVLVGIAWALFYAYFFWSRFDWPPAVQGLAFAVLPSLLALFLVYPQLQLMHVDARIATIGPGVFLGDLDVPTVAGLLIGHAVYGLVVGAIYTHPVGYPAGREPVPDLGPRSPRQRDTPGRRSGRGFIFATGIECSYPTIEQGRWRRDELGATGHYQRWSEDFELAREIGVSHLRYGPPLHLVFRGAGHFDWEAIDAPMAELREEGPEPIVDLCHFGLPDWLGDFQNPDIGKALAEYAAAFAARYPWVRFYTPVNEMYVCARMSALDGTWNEQLSDEAAFARAVLHMADASVRMTDAILAARSDAIFVNSESSEFCQPCCPDEHIQAIAAFENERRFLALDLIYAHALSDSMRGYLRDHGIADAALDRFARREVPARSILGLDYYEWNERLIDKDGRPRALGELFGWYVIASQYYDRYQRPMMYTETNRMDAAEAPRWLWRQWHNVQLLRGTGVPLVGFTWYSLLDQVDWQIGISKALGRVFPVGLFDLNRDPRPVGLAYKNLIDMHCDWPDYRHSKALDEVMG